MIGEIKLKWRAVALVILGVALFAQGAYIPLKAALAQVLLERAWTKVESGELGTKAWSWADTSPVGRLHIKDENFIVLSGASGEAMAFGPALMEGMEQPIISAHRDTHFKILGEVEIGDEVRWTTTEGETTYRIAQMEVVKTPRASITPGALILTTCWPLDGLTRGPERLIITAFEVERGGAEMSVEKT
jgi:sortase A